MLKYFWCWFWGCKTVMKAYTGETMVQSNGLGMEVTVAMYKWQKQPFCIRCGKPSKAEPSKA